MSASLETIIGDIHRPATRAEKAARASKTSRTRFWRLIHVQNPYLFHAYAPSARTRLRARDRRSGYS